MRLPSFTNCSPRCRKQFPHANGYWPSAGLFRKTSYCLEEVPTNIPQRVQKADLRINEISCVPTDAFKNLFWLTSLNLEMNKISEIEGGAWRGLGQLKTLKLNDNKLTEINSEIWNGLSSLEKLDLSGNKIVCIACGHFSSLKNLQFLDLMANQLSALEAQVFCGLRKLKQLDLTNNNIYKIANDAFQELDALETLHLSMNKLQSLSAEVFKPLPRPIKLSLDTPNKLHYKQKATWKCSSLCWLKAEEEAKTIIWSGAGAQPRCPRGVKWEHLFCIDPGKSFCFDFNIQWHCCRHSSFQLEQASSKVNSARCCLWSQVVKWFWW